MAKQGFRHIKEIFSRPSNQFLPLSDAFAECIELFDGESKNREANQRLRAELETLFGDLSKSFNERLHPSLLPSMTDLARGLEQEACLLRGRLGRRRIDQYANSDEDSTELLESYRRIQGMLQRHSLNANSNMWNIIEEQAMENRLKNLLNLPAAMYRSAESVTLRGECTPNTRMDVMEILCRWANDSYSHKICWLNGMAGTGKTTIAYSLCRQFEAQHALAASFFCSRRLPGCRDVNRIIPTISYQLARFSRPFCLAISQVLTNDPDIPHQSLPDQFAQLIFKPLDQVKEALPDNVNIVVDALDECDDRHGVGQILDVLLAHAPTLPIKFLVASRPEAIILGRQRRRHGEHIPFELRLHEIKRTLIQQDINTYLRAELISRADLSMDDLDTLVKRSGILFTYAAMVVQYVGEESPFLANRHLGEILNASEGWSDHIDRKMDKLYAPILEAAFHDLEPTQFRRAMKLILDTVACVQDSLHVNALAGLLGLDEALVRSALRRLGSVLQVSDDSDAIIVLHGSFPDYLLNETLSHAFYCDTKRHNAYLAQSCFDRIDALNQSFHTRNLTLSHFSDGDRDTPSFGTNDISEESLYACRYWAYHLVSGEYSLRIASTFHTFLSECLLLWMEVMNLKGYINVAKGMLCQVQEWSQTASCLDESTKQLLRDACILTISFSPSLDTLDIPRTHISELSLWGSHGPIAEHVPQQQSRPITEDAETIVRRTISLTITDTREGARSIAYSADLARIVSASHDCTLQIWDAHTGQAIGRPLHGHTSTVTSLAYSPNGAYIVSGSADKTIRIWDARTGQTIQQLLSGHTDAVKSVAYSPNGPYVASGSDDKTIRIWDTRSGQTIKQLLNGHTGGIISVAYSPDGAHIISGSSDHTIRIWNAQTGWKIGPPLKGHTNSVVSLAYLPGGTRIVSSSDDKTIRIWDTVTGLTIGQPLKGYTMGVDSVLCSPDNAYIVSAGEFPIALYVTRYDTLV
ncbi:F-box/WD repeat-containing protein 9 [Ceratobasidium sp. 394]|nr:F-box/WD repeat-containing protein 9 [Ceratobasidium sp. 394]